MYSEELSQRIQDCREIYFKYNGQDHASIEKEMREMGYRNFHRRVLYSRYERGKHKEGWPATYGWSHLLKEIRKKDSPPYEGGVAPASGDGVVFSLSDDPSKNHPTATAAPLLRKEGSILPDFDEFKAWLKRTWPKMTWEWKHQVYIYKHLKRVWNGECKRLMIFMPPRHGKSELVTVRFPAWTLKHKPETKIIIGCYNQRLANRFSRMARAALAEDAAFGTKAEPPASAGGRDAGSGSTSDSKLTDTQRPPQRSTQSMTNATPPAYAGGSAFPYRLINSESEWETTQGGGVRAVGVGAGVTGYGAHLIIVDDPVKSRAEAESETFRERVWNWFNDDLYTRLEPDGKIILIQTRWHEDDLAGRLLREAEQGGEQWEVINLPAIAEATKAEPPASAGGEHFESKSMSDSPHTVGQQPSQQSTPLLTNATPPAYAGGSALDPLGRREGEALCPERYNEEKLARIHRKIGSYSFAALYQQRPAPAEGGQFKRSWFKKVIDAAPEGLMWKRGYDLAVSTKQTADYTASFRCAKDAQGNLYIADGFRARIEYPEQRRYVLGRMKDEPSTEHGIEAALHGQAFVQDLRRGLGLGRFAFRAVRVDADKLTRALAWLNLAEEGKLYLVRGPWIDAFVDEIARFPTGKHNDQIDAVSLAVNMLEQRRFKSMGF